MANNIAPKVFKAGMIIFNFRLVQKVRNKKGQYGERWVMECIPCKKRITKPKWYLSRDEPLQHCGCLNKGLPTQHPRLYSIFYMMHVRTSDPRHQAYKDYGGRGIVVCERWAKTEEGFKNFINDMQEPPSSKHTLDRINNDGNYEPSNCRWATAKMQRANQRPRKPKL